MQEEQTAQTSDRNSKTFAIPPSGIHASAPTFPNVAARNVGLSPRQAGVGQNEAGPLKHNGLLIALASVGACMP